MTITLGKCWYCGKSLVQALKGRDRKFCRGTNCGELCREMERGE